MQSFADHFLWFLFIDFTCILAFTYWVFGKITAEQNPELVDGYKAITKGILLYGNIPWVIMGIGSLAGWVENDFEFFLPDGFQPIVMLFHLVMLVGIAALLIWLIYLGGDRFLLSHPNSAQVWRPVLPPAERQKIAQGGGIMVFLFVLAWITLAWLNAFDLI